MGQWCSSILVTKNVESMNNAYVQKMTHEFYGNKMPLLLVVGIFQRIGLKQNKIRHCQLAWLHVFELACAKNS